MCVWLSRRYAVAHIAYVHAYIRTKLVGYTYISYIRVTQVTTGSTGRALARGRSLKLIEM